MTNEQRNTAQDILDGLLRDAYSRGFADATNDQKIKPINETMTTYNLHILDKMIQHHYETQEVIRPTQEEVENALNSIMWHIRRLEEQNVKMLDTLKKITEYAKALDMDCSLLMGSRIISIEERDQKSMWAVPILESCKIITHVEGEVR